MERGVKSVKIADRSCRENVENSLNGSRQRMMGRSNDGVGVKMIYLFRKVVEWKVSN